MARTITRQYPCTCASLQSECFPRIGRLRYHHFTDWVRLRDNVVTKEVKQQQCACVWQRRDQRGDTLGIVASPYFTGDNSGVETSSLRHRVDSAKASSLEACSLARTPGGAYSGFSDGSAAKRMYAPNTVRTFEIKLKRNWNKTVMVLVNHCRYTLFERETRGAGGTMTYAWRRRSQRWIVALPCYCNALLLGLTTIVTRCILPKVNSSVSSYCYRN